MTTRFAPSPTGYLHLGHAVAAKTAFEHSETCLLRIEDIDHTRCRPKYTQAIYEDLIWLGFKWPEPVRIQSTCLNDYADVIKNLQSRELVYRCFKTRKNLPTGLYNGQNKIGNIAAESLVAKGHPFAWRLDMKKAARQLPPLIYEETGLKAGIKPVTPQNYGDVVLARKDIGTSYLIASTHDDAHQGVTDVVRGADFIELTGMQRILQTLMDWPEPAYHHHALLTNPDGEKLAKRNKDTSIRELREMGHSPRVVLDMASQAQAG